MGKRNLDAPRFCSEPFAGSGLIFHQLAGPPGEFFWARASAKPALNWRANAMAALENVADLILCDLDLPVMDGYQVAGALRQAAQWRPVPLLAFTGDSPGDAHTESLARAAGFQGFIFKPVDARTFSATIAQHVPPGPTPAGQHPQRQHQRGADKAAEEQCVVDARL